MNIGKACAIFDQINSDKYTEQEKLNAIKQVIEMPTHNGVTKYKILNAFRWFFDWAVEESSQKQTNADRIRSMSDEELAEWIHNISQDYDEEQEPTVSIYNLDTKKDMELHDSYGDLLNWLQSEVEE